MLLLLGTGLAFSPPCTDPGRAGGSSAQDAVTGHYDALNRRNYRAAWSYLSTKTRGELGGYARWVAGHRSTIAVTTEAPRLLDQAAGIARVRVRIWTQDRDACRRLVTRRFSGIWIAINGHAGWRLIDPRLRQVSGPRRLRADPSHCPPEPTAFVIEPNALSSPSLPRAEAGTDWTSLQQLWGAPKGCEYAVPCSDDSGDIAYYPGGVVVIKDATVRSFSISAPAWRTPEGARVADAAETLRGLYAGRLTAVRNRHQFVGMSNLDRFGFMVVDGDDALGFGMAAGRVESIIAGSAVEVRRELGVYGPV